MENIIINSLKESIETKEKLLATLIKPIEELGLLLAECVANGGKLLFCGNGGSAADAQHLAAELVVRFRSSVNRPAIAAMALTVDPSIMTAGGNDIGFDNVFARQVEAIGRKEDVLIGISTSGNSQNVLNAIHAAQEKSMKTIALLGGDGGEIIKSADHSLVVTSFTTARIQEAHITVGHIWCEIIEEVNFKEYIK